MIFLPFPMVTSHIGLKTIQSPNNDGIHSVLSGSFNIPHIPERRHRLLLGPQPHGELVEIIKFALMGQNVVTQTMLNGSQGFPVASVVGLHIRVLAPKKCFKYTASPNAYFQPTTAKVVQHAVFFNQLDRMVQWQYTDSRPKPNILSSLRYSGKKHVLRRSQTVHGWSVMFS